MQSAMSWHFFIRGGQYDVSIISVEFPIPIAISMHFPFAKVRDSLKVYIFFQYNTHCKRHKSNVLWQNIRYFCYNV